MKVTVEHMRKAKLCAPGFRRWANARGIPRSKQLEFLREGWDIEYARSVADGITQKVIEIAEREATGGQ